MQIKWQPWDGARKKVYPCVLVMHFSASDSTCQVQLCVVMRAAAVTASCDNVINCRLFLKTPEWSARAGS